ncbi:MAG: bifunctional sulfate adenylyltransferase subunit 1/adenylylsulfate kinase [Bacteroidetes bacterium QH_7_62_13]|jgi:bifunctional enzyme CysN/CysC|nr:MAG: bifunctional sulfate adenylyltransferase subunit 1/adenylylsulfate kinase [Bacteroidetes bacterium QH_7_62_13]
MDVLRFTTAGSVDDGKSTLIGRLFYDTQQIFENKLEEIRRNTQRDDDEIELGLLTDGLRAEREQGITIDVAYRYFSTPDRKFIIADTPGHEQYTRNMVTGASTAEVAVELIDARNGVLEQTRRHAFIASLLQIPYMIVAVNKMDLVGYSEDRFREIVDQFHEFSDDLDIKDITFVPISALKGDNVVHESDNMPWYKGSTLLHRLENVRPEATRNQVDFRFPVQTVIRPHQDFRGFAGQVASGKIRPGEEIVELPSKRTSHVESITTLDGEMEEAGPGDSVVLSLTDEIDVSRGSMIVRSRNRPEMVRQIDADLCWMNEEKMRKDRPYVIQHTTRRTQAYVSKVVYRTNVNTFHREEADTFALNDIGRVELETADPLFIDPYKINRSTGNFILIDPDTNETVAAGMIRGVAEDVAPFGAEETVTDEERESSPNVVWEGLNVPRENREEKNDHKAAVVWLTGLSGAGKSTIAKEVEQRLFDRDHQTMMLDGDNVRHGLCGDLGFTPRDRKENIRRVGEVARLFFEQGNITLCTFISPYQEDRDRIRELLPDGRFFEVHVDCPLEVCKERDTKGLYEKAETGEIANFTGVSAPYEEPEDPEVVVRTDEHDVETNVAEIIDALEEAGIV